MEEGKERSAECKECNPSSHEKSAKFNQNQVNSTTTKVFA
jgi:hypothetical protein